MYCQRNIHPCPICNQPVHKQRQSDHQHCPECGFVTSHDHMAYHTIYSHTPRQCTCGEFVCQADQAAHYLQTCPKRAVCCRFCHESHSRDCSNYEQLRTFQQDPVDRFEGLTLHESVCANKTTECSICHEYVMNRYLIQHYQIQHHKPGMSCCKEFIIVVDNCYVVCDICGFRQNCVMSMCLV